MVVNVIRSWEVFKGLIHMALKMVCKNNVGDFLTIETLLKLSYYNCNEVGSNNIVVSCRDIGRCNNTCNTSSAI